MLKFRDDVTPARVYFLNLGFVFVLWLSEFGSDVVSTWALNQFRKVRTRIGWWQWIVKGISYYSHATDRPHGPIWMPLGPELNEIFHRLILIDDFKIYFLPHLARYLKYYKWFIYYGQISKTWCAIFWISVSFPFDGPVNLAQTAFSRGFLKALNQSRKVGARMGWSWILEGIVY